MRDVCEPTHEAYSFIQVLLLEPPSYLSSISEMDKFDTMKQKQNIRSKISDKYKDDHVQIVNQWLQTVFVKFWQVVKLFVKFKP